jgi:hypothetical protein
MVWQDYVLMLGGMILWISIIPMIKAKEKPPFLTSIPTSVTLTIFVVCLVTLHLYIAAFSTSGTAIFWWILVFQRAKPASRSGQYP